MHNNDRWSNPNDLDLGLSSANCLHDDDVLSGSVQNPHSILRSLSYSSSIATCGHAAYENVMIRRQLLHSNPVTQESAARKRTGRVNGYHADGFASVPVFVHDFACKRAFSSAAWAS